MAKRGSNPLSFAERAAEKARARAEDARQLAAGEISREELGRRNSLFGGFGPGALRKARVIFPEKE